MFIILLLLRSKSGKLKRLYQQFYQLLQPREQFQKSDNEKYKFSFLKTATRTSETKVFKKFETAFKLKTEISTQKFSNFYVIPQTTAVQMMVNGDTIT